MKSQLITIFFIAICLVCRADRFKKQIAWQISDATWQKIVFRHSDPPKYGEGSFIMVSNRPLQPLRSDFAAEYSDTTQQHILWICPVHDSFYVYELKTLEQAIGSMPQKNWVLYTEGMGKTFTGNLQRAQLMSKTYDVNVILFDYASINSQYSGRKNYYFSLHNALNACGQYTRFLQQIQQIRQHTNLFGEMTVNIFLHSMGNLMFRKMMLENRHAIFQHQPFIDNVIFNAACVNRKNHHRWIHQIDFAKTIFINYNPDDRKLGGAMLISGNRKLGSKPKHPFDRTAHYMNFHDAVGKNHSYFLNIPGRTFVMSESIRDYYQHLLQGKALPPEKKFAPAKPVGTKMNSP